MQRLLYPDFYPLELGVDNACTNMGVPCDENIIGIMR